MQDGFKVGVLDYNPETAEKAVAELSAEMPLRSLLMYPNKQK